MRKEGVRLNRRGFFKLAVAAPVAGYQVGGGASPVFAGIRSFDHVALPMENTEAMLAFYRALGCQVIETERICSVHFGDHKINFHRPALWQSGDFTLRAPQALPPCGDLCFVWGGDADSLNQTLEGAGAEIIEGPVQRTGGRSMGTLNGTSVYIRDPDGNLLEFIIYG